MHMMRNYEIDIAWSAEDQLFIARVPELPGCMAHGDTRAEALAQAELAIEGWLDAAHKMGRNIPEPRTFSARTAV
jgi:predicted RNase H-like HicB family nuclease